MANTNALSTTTSKVGAMNLKSSSRNLISTGNNNINVIKILNSLVYACGTLNSKIDNAIYNNESAIELVINELQSMGCDVIELIRFLCCRGYTVKKLDKNRSSETIVEYKPNEYDTSGHIVEINDNDMYLMVDWTIKNNIIYIPATYILNLNIS